MKKKKNKSEDLTKYLSPQRAFELRALREEQKRRRLIEEAKKLRQKEFQQTHRFTEQKVSKKFEGISKSIGKGFKGLAPKTYKSSKPDYKGFLNKLGGKR